MHVALAVRLPQLILCGAASDEHVLHLQMTAAWSDSNAVTCRTIGGTLGISGVAACVHPC